MKNRYEKRPLAVMLNFFNGKAIKPGGVGRYHVYGANGIIGGCDESNYRNGIIIGRVGAYCGSVQHCYEKFWASDNTIVAQPKSGEYNVRYLYYLLQDLNLNNFAGGAAQPLVTQTVLKQVEGFSPPIEVQNKIAAILSAYDDLIENNTRRIKILEEMAQAIYREWFVHFRIPGHEKVRMIDSPLGKIPEGWEIEPLGNLCNRVTDGSHFSPLSVEVGYPMASVKDMHDWGFNEESCRLIAESDYHKLVRNDCKPLVNDVLIAKDGSYLKHAFVVMEEMDLVILSSIAILRPNILKVLPHVLCMYLRQPDIRSRLSGYVSGVALPRIILKDFTKFLVVKPVMSIQTQFMLVAEHFVRFIHILIKKNSTLCQTRELLLPKLISGELDVSELDIDTGGLRS